MKVLLRHEDYDYVISERSLGSGEPTLLCRPKGAFAYYVIIVRKSRAEFHGHRQLKLVVAIATAFLIHRTLHLGSEAATVPRARSTQFNLSRKMVR